MDGPVMENQVSHPKLQQVLNRGKSVLGSTVSAWVLVVVLIVLLSLVFKFKLTASDLTETPVNWVVEQFTLRRDGPQQCWPVSPIAMTEEPLVRLAVVGDVGEWTKSESDIAGEIVKSHNDRPFDAVLLLGDNVYQDGDPDVLKDRILPRLASLTDDGVMILAVLGNHDIEDGNGAAQVEVFDLPGPWYSKGFDDLLVVALDSNHPDYLVQEAWLESVLDEAEEQWIVAIMHHPPYSHGSHGGGDVSEKWIQSFKDHDVALVLAGHEHDYQRLKPQDGVAYLVTGGGSKTRPTADGDKTVAAWGKVLHFVEIDVWSDRLEIRAIEQHGEVFDEATLVDAGTEDVRWESTTRHEGQKDCTDRVRWWEFW